MLNRIDVSNNPVNYRDWLGLAIEAGTGLPDDSDDHDGDGVSNENDSNPYSYDNDPLASLMSDAVDFVEDVFDFLYNGVKDLFSSMWDNATTVDQEAINRMARPRAEALADAYDLYRLVPTSAGDIIGLGFSHFNKNRDNDCDEIGMREDDTRSEGRFE